MKGYLVLLLCVAVAFSASQNNTLPIARSTVFGNAAERSVATPGRTGGWNWPYPTTADASRNFLGINVQMSDINVAGTGSNQAIVQPGQTVSVSFSFSSTQGPAGYCPGCIVQWYWGLSEITTPQNPAAVAFTPVQFCHSATNWYGFYSQSGSFSTSFTAPSFPGMQYFQWGSTLDYQCDNIGFSQCGEGAWGAICVAGDTDGDGVDDCFDPCPCIAGSDCPFFVSYPGDETLQCSSVPDSSVVQRNDYCGSSRASTGFLDTPQEVANATSQCPETYYRTWTLTDQCTGSSQSVTSFVTEITSCDTAVNGEIQGAVVSSSPLTFWGYDGAGNPEYLAEVSITFSSAVNDWRVGVQLPNAGDHVVNYGNYYSVFNGAEYSCGSFSQGTFTVAPAGQWSAQIAAGGSVIFEYVATNVANQDYVTVQSETVFTVYSTANS